jgi:hypothetical protein
VAATRADTPGHEQSGNAQANNEEDYPYGASSSCPRSRLLHAAQLNLLIQYAEQSYHRFFNTPMRYKITDSRLQL